MRFKEIKPTKLYVVFTNIFATECDSLYDAKNTLELNGGGTVYKKDEVNWYTEEGLYERSHSSPILIVQPVKFYGGYLGFLYSNGRKSLSGWEVSKPYLENACL